MDGITQDKENFRSKNFWNILQDLKESLSIDEMEQKRKEIRDICKSAFGSEFMKSHSDSDADFSTILEMLQKDAFANVNEVRLEAIAFLDDQVRWFENPTLEIPDTKYQRSEMIAMAENLKQRFLDLVDDSKANGSEFDRRSFDGPLISPGPSQLEKATLLGVFAVTLSTAILDSMKYVAVVMYKGTLFVPHDEALPLLNGNLELGKKYDIKFVWQDPFRVSFDQVELNLGVKKYCVENPGSADMVVNQLSEKPIFYLQTTGVEQVDKFLVRKRQCRWVLDAKLLGNAFWAGGVQDWSRQSPKNWKEQCELVAHSDLKCFLQRCSTQDFPDMPTPSDDQQGYVELTKYIN